MSRLPLKDGTRHLMDGVTERGVMAKQYLTQRALSVQSRLRQVRTSQLQALREQGLLGRYLYPAMRVLVYLGYQALVLLVRLRSRVRQMSVPRVLLARERLARLPSLLTQALRSLGWRLQGAWDQLRLRARRRSVSLAWREQQGLAASPRSRVTPLKFLHQKWQVVLGRWNLMGMRTYFQQAWKQLVQRAALMFGDLSMTVKHLVGRQLMTAKHQVGQLLMTVKHQIGKR